MSGPYRVRKSDADWQREITAWVEWFRGLNNPETQWKVAERQLNMLKAEKRITHWEVVYDLRRGPRVVLHTANKLELEQLEEALAKVFPKVPREPPGRDREEYLEQRDDAMQDLIKVIGEAVAIHKGSK